MIHVNKLQNRSIEEIIKILDINASTAVDLTQLAHTLSISILPYDFTNYKIDGNQLLCAFITNQNDDSCIFYSNDLVGTKRFFPGRTYITQAFARYIITRQKNFYITADTVFENKEKQLAHQLLMPEEQINDVIARLIRPTTDILSQIFQVNKELIVARLNEINMRMPIAGFNC
jgi:hypothetical protein